MIDIRTGKEMTRREFGRGLAAIIGAGVAPSIALGLVGSANATVGGMMRNVGARNAAMFGVKSLPYDREVDYLLAVATTSTEYKYINTGLRDLGSNFLIEARYLLESDFNNDIFGAYNNRTILCLNYDTSHKFFFRLSSTGAIVSQSLNYNIITDVSITQDTLIVNGSSYNYDSRSIYSNSDILLFACRFYQGNDVRQYTRFYSFKVIKKGSVIMDLVPVVKDNIGYMYDRANPTGGPLGNGLYGNAGTGYFDFPGRIS